MSDKAKEWFFEQFEFDFDDFTLVSPWGEYGGLSNNGKFYECLESYHKHQMSKELEEAEQFKQTAFVNYINSSESVKESECFDDGMTAMLNHLKKKIG